MRCEDARTWLDAYRTGEIPAAEERDVAGHLAECAGCAGALAELTHLAGAARGLRVSAPDGIVGVVLAALGDAYDRLETAMGPAWVAFSPRGVTMIWLGDVAAADFEAAYTRRLGRTARPGALPERYAAAVRAAAAGERYSAVPCDLATLTPFERQVLDALARIPRGETRPYAWLAREVGRPRAVRAVGGVMARNPAPLLLPCHRVVPTTGGVGNYAFGSAFKRELLQREGLLLDEMEALARSGARYLGCASTRIYCLPSCRDIRRARPVNRVPFASEAAAAAAGYRPCQHCRPAALVS